MPEDLIERGIKAAQSGDRKLAQELLFQAVQQNPRAARAWFWLGQALNDPAKKQFCLVAAAKIDPAVVDQEQTALLMALADAETASAVPTAIIPAQSSSGAGQQRGLILGLMGLGVLAVFVLAAALLGGGAFGPPARTRTPDLAATQTYERLGFQVTAARELLDAEQSQPCIDYYDALLEEMPNWTVGYYNRGLCKRLGKKDLTDLSIYEALHRSAIQDQDKAIRLDPEFDHAHVERAFDYMNLTNIAENRVDEDRFNAIALENLLHARALNSDHPSLDWNIAWMLIQLNRCEEGLQEAYAIIDTTPSGDDRSNLYGIIAEGHNCLGEYSEALPFIEKSVAYKTTRGNVQTYATSLIGAGKMGTAQQLLDRDLECCPEFSGYRYYLRAVIDLDQGDYEMAWSDTDMGAMYTWYRRGLYFYLMGRLALYDGDKEGAIEWFQKAAGSVMPNEGAWVKERIHAELDKLGVKYKPPKPTLRLKVTPIPPYSGSANNE